MDDIVVQKAKELDGYLNQVVSIQNQSIIRYNPLEFFSAQAGTLQPPYTMISYNGLQTQGAVTSKGLKADAVFAIFVCLHTETELTDSDYYSMLNVLGEIRATIRRQKCTDWKFLLERPQEINNLLVFEQVWSCQVPVEGTTT